MNRTQQAARNEAEANAALHAAAASLGLAVIEWPRATPAQAAGRNAYDADVRARYFAMQREA